MARMRGERVEPLAIRMQRQAANKEATAATPYNRASRSLQTAQRAPAIASPASVSIPFYLVSRANFDSRDLQDTSQRPTRSTTAVLRESTEVIQAKPDMKKHIRDLRYLVKHLEQENKDLRGDAAALHKHLSFSGMLEAEKRVNDRLAARTTTRGQFSKGLFETFEDGQSAKIDALRIRIKQVMDAEVKQKVSKKVPPLQPLVSSKTMTSIPSERAPLQAINVQQKLATTSSNTSDKEKIIRQVASAPSSKKRSNSYTIDFTQSSDEDVDCDFTNRFAQLTKPSRLIEFTSSEEKKALKNQYHFLIRTITPLDNSTVKCSSVAEIVWILKHQGVPVKTIDVTHLSGEKGEFAVEVDERFVCKMPQINCPILKSNDNRSVAKFGHLLPNFLVERLDWIRCGPTKLICKDFGNIPSGSRSLPILLRRNADQPSLPSNIIAEVLKSNKRKRHGSIVGEDNDEEDKQSAYVKLRWEKVARLETSSEDIEVTEMPLRVDCSNEIAKDKIIYCTFYECETCHGESDTCQVETGTCRYEKYRK